MQSLTDEPRHAARWISSRIACDLEDLLASQLPDAPPPLRAFVSRRASLAGGASDAIALAVRLVLIQRLMEVARWEDHLSYGFHGREADDPAGRLWSYVVRLESRVVKGRREDWADWATIYEASPVG
jgi:hypothetical protein